MKQLHKPNLWSWSLFNEERNLDFHSVFWARPAGGVTTGGVMIDPLPLSAHDAVHVAAVQVQQAFGATGGAAVRIWGPALEPQLLASLGAHALRPEHELGAELQVIELHGSKTPGELCLLLDGATLVTGDLLRGHRAGWLNLLPDAKLSDKAQAIASLERLARLEQIEAVLVGDGWPVFRAGAAALRELLSAVTH
jgi:hypothetical protein